MTPRPPQAAAPPRVEQAAVTGTPTRPAGGSTRLQRLLELRDRLNADIAREMAQERGRVRVAANGTRRHVATRQEWTNQLVAAAACHYGITVAALHGPARVTEVAEARHIACWLLREAGRSYSEIGRTFGCHHTTALHSVRRVNNDDVLRATARRIYLALTEGAA